MLRLMPSRPDLHCLLVGAADDERFLDGLRRRIGAAGLADRIVFRPHLDWSALADHHAAMDVYAAPPRWEGFGLTPLEAMASGVPVVTTRVGAFPDIVAPDAGRLIPSDDLDALVTALAHLVDDGHLRTRMGQAARAHVVARHPIEGEAEALIAIYRELLSR
jgi:mannosyltransferase